MKSIPAFAFIDLEGNWFEFIFRKRYRGQVKIFSTGSVFGIAGGRISKLLVTDGDLNLVFNYDRGYDLDALPSGILSRLMEFLIDEHNKHMKKHERGDR